MQPFRSPRVPRRYLQGFRHRGVRVPRRTTLYCRKSTFNCKSRLFRFQLRQLLASIRSPRSSSRSVRGWGKVAVLIDGLVDSVDKAAIFGECTRSEYWNEQDVSKNRTRCLCINDRNVDDHAPCSRSLSFNNVLVCLLCSSESQSW